MADDKRLSILICSLGKRAALLRRLKVCLSSQVTNEVEVISHIDDGKLSIGQKRNNLLNEAVGDYVSFIDDDDLVSDDYISKILTAVKTEPDCCSLRGEISHTINTVKMKRLRRRVQRVRTSQRVKHTFIHSLKYDHWFEKDGYYFRCPNHLNAIKRTIAKQIGFPHKDSGEDKSFSLGVYPLLKTEVEIKGVIYYYLAS